MLSRASFHGRFAHQNWHSNSGWWWRNHHSIVAIGWFGGLFWPYAYWDFLDYTFWPYAYDEFWPYAYDDFYVGMFGPYAYEGPEYASRVRYGRRGRNVRQPSTTATVVCGAPVPELTNWPIEQISKTVEPNEAQQAALAEFKDATGKAMDALKAACPDDLPSTPTGRMAAMHKRIAAMLLAINIVQPPLQRFYKSLTDEQKARFNVVNSEEQPARLPRRSSRLDRSFAGLRGAADQGDECAGRSHRTGTQAHRRTARCARLLSMTQRRKPPIFSRRIAPGTGS